MTAPVGTLGDVGPTVSALGLGLMGMSDMSVPRTRTRASPPSRLRYWSVDDFGAPAAHVRDRMGIGRPIRLMRLHQARRLALEQLCYSARRLSAYGADPTKSTTT
jgi:hypothetical protein